MSRRTQTIIWGIRALIVLISILVAVIFAEYYLKWEDPRNLDPPLAEQLIGAIRFQQQMKKNGLMMKAFDPLFHHAIAANKSVSSELEGRPFNFTSNNAGFRSSIPYQEGPHPDTFRIAVMGDSFSVGLYVDDTEMYSYQLNQMLQMKPGGKKWEVYNFANISYSPLLYWQLYRHVVRKYQPDLIILAMDNSDLQDDFYYEQDAIWDAEGHLTGFKDDHYSFFLGQVRNIGTPEQRVEDLIRKIHSPWQRFLGYCKSHFQIAAHIRDYIDRSQFVRGDIHSDRFGHNREGVDWTEHWKRTEKYMEKFMEETRKDDIPVLLLFYPYPHQVNGTDWPGRKNLGLSMGKVYDTPMRKWLKDFAEQFHLNYIDAFPAFRDRNMKDFSFKTDPHYLPSGHELLAGLLRDQILEFYNKPEASPGKK